IMGEEQFGGMTLHERLSKTVQSSLYTQQSEGPDGRKALMIKGIVDDYRLLARDKMLREFPELRMQIESAQRTRRGAALVAPTGGVAPGGGPLGAVASVSRGLTA